MKKYQVSIDVTHNDWEDIEVEEYVIEAIDAEQAESIAQKRAEKEFEDFYVWEVSEDDVIEED